MGIQVECPNGHTFKVKDKYAGKKGLCPHCEGQVIVQVPDALTANQATDTLQREAIQRRQAAQHAAQPKPAKQAAASQSTSDSHVFDDPNEMPAAPSSGTSGSLLGSSVIRHNIKCRCGQHVPMWYARCPACGQYLEH
jgi:hypothetical protein